MKYLLDTHIALWALAGDPSLPEEAQVTILDTKNELFVSVASLWEAAIKCSIGKLKIPFANIEPDLDLLGVQVLGIGIEHCRIVESLPFVHSDPFDRMLIAQCLADDMQLLTHDTKLPAYGAFVRLV